MRRRAMGAMILLVLGACAGLVALFYFGVLQLNNPSAKDYPIRGVDVSSYQGEIDWETLNGQNISFAFIKATEGSSHIDTAFERNFAEARKTGLRIGAYHFFSFDSPGWAQAEHFIRVVPKLEGGLPPAVDLEYYGDKAKNPPDPDLTRGELRGLLEALRAHYGVTPIVYATAESYERYVAGDFFEYDIWIRDVFSKPKLPDGRTWTFWQYANRVRLSGYQGKEKYIDMNVFSGSAAAFAQYGLPEAL